MGSLRGGTTAGVAGIGLGAAAVASAHGIRAALGDAPDADVVAVALLAAGFLLGTRRGGGPRALGLAVAGIGVLSAVVGSWSSPIGGALARVGGGADGGVIAAAFARALLAGVPLVPLGGLLGLAARRLGSSAAPASLAVGMAAGALGGVALHVAGNPGPLAPAGSAVLVLVGIGLAARPPSAGESEETRASPGPLLGAVAAGFAGAAFAFLAPRPFQFAFGHELPGIPVVGAALAAGVVVGALVGAGLARLVAGAAEAAAALLLAGSGTAAIVALGRLDALPVAFLSSIESVNDLGGVVDAGLRLALGPVAVVGAGIGAAATLLLRAMPPARFGTGAFVGAVAGTVFARCALGPLDIPEALGGAGIVTAVLAAAAAVTVATPRRRVVGALAGGAGIALVGIAAARAPGYDPRMILPDRHFATGRIGVEQAGWLMLERDEANESVAVIRRGRARRLLVDGRLEATNGLSTRSDGVLAHLPLAVHPAPRRVLLLGLGNGAALASAASHPVERVDCFERGPAFVEAARTFGESVRSALSDERVRIRFGDPEDLVARSGRYDVVLHQASGGWSELSARLSTREFLETVRDRLDAGGVYCQRVPDAALTKNGLLSLLATVGAVFPQVEVWAGSGSALIVLAKKTPSPHDFENVLAAYRDPRIRAAATEVWIAEPLSLLSHFLVSDAVVRRVAKDAPIHTRADGELARVEAERRRRAGTVNPVPGLSALGDELLPHLVHTPETGFETAVANASHARALERTALEHELRRGGPHDTQALEAWEAALELNPRDRAVRRRLADLRSRMGIEYTNQQSVLAAYSNLRQAVEIDSTFAEGFANLGRHLAMADEYDFAVAVTEHAIELEPDNETFALLLAQIWKRRTYYDKALPWYEKAMELNPRYVSAAIGYVDTKLSMEENPDLEHGLEISRRYLALEPENEELRSRVAKLELAIRDRDAGTGPARPEPAAPDSAEDPTPAPE